MPNWVTNIINLSGKGIQEMLHSIKSFDEADKEVRYIDFNKIIPMPESLNITSGGLENRSIAAYLEAVNPDTGDYGVEKFDKAVYEKIVSDLKNDGCYASVFSVENEGENPVVAEYLEIGKKYVNNFVKYGSTTWYDWCISNWGTKWNACHTEVYDDTLQFETAWNTPFPILQKLSEMYPDITFNCSWADEDFGYNVGKITFKGGQIKSQNIPRGGSKEAIDIAAEVHGCDPEDFGYYYNKKTREYEYHFDEE